MGETSNILWTDATFNPWIGCAKISPGCDHCYAERWAARFPQYAGCWEGRHVTMSDAYWTKPLAWNRRCEREGRRMRVMCGSLCDVMEHNQSADLTPMRRRLGELILATPYLDYLLTTKRPENAGEFSSAAWPGADRWPANAHLVLTAENQALFDTRAPVALRLPAASHILSLEPLLGPVDVRPYLGVVHADQIGADEVPDDFPAIVMGGGSIHPPMYSSPWRDGFSWVIVGGETGPNARPLNPQWARDVRDQCAAAGIHFMLKPWGEWAPDGDASGSGVVVTDCHNGGSFGPDGSFRPGVFEAGCQHMARVGKARAGRMLDGREWNETPENNPKAK